MRTEILNYEADGVQLRSTLYYEAGVSGKRPGVLVFPDAFGLGGQVKSRAERLAALGYVALACDFYGQGQVVKELEAAMGLLGPLRENPASIRARAQAGLAALRAHPELDGAHVAAIGYCFGGTMALELARSGVQIAGVVGFHSGLATRAPAEAGAIKGKVLVCIGADDPGIDAAQRQGFEAEMRAGQVNWQMNLYGGVVHSFTNPEADRMGRPDFARYDAQADARSWAEMRAFLAEIFAPAGA
jgi:dienelactone hydrolase